MTDRGRTECKGDGCTWTWEGDLDEAARQLIVHMMVDHGLTDIEARASLTQADHFYRPLCVRCDRLFEEDCRAWPVSRTDNRTQICHACGGDEALEDMTRGKVTPKDQWPVESHEIPPTHGFQSPDWRDQRSNRSHRPNPVPTPKEMPDLRLHLLERWVAGGIFDEISRYQPRTLPSPGTDRAWERQALRNASLWWIKDEMVDLTTAAARSIPEEVQGGEIDMPADQPFGLAVLGKTWEGIDSADPDNPCHVDAILWGPAVVGGVPCLTVSMYRYLDFAGGLSPTELQMATQTGIIGEAKQERIGQTVGDGGIPEGQPTYRLYGGAWAWMGRTDWPLMSGLLDFDELPFREFETDQSRLAMAEDRRWFAALCVLVNHRLSETEPVYAARQTRRRAERAGVAREQAPSTVRIIRLREARHEHPDDGEHDGKRQVEWSHRWISSGHMGWRRCGPGRTQRRLVFIPPSVKGPKDLPLVIKENVRVWVK